MKSNLWPGHLLVCDEQTGQIMVLDPSGARAPRRVGRPPRPLTPPR
ncbi:MAG: hypothetical protein HC927_02705 [Deltaproteobacteria bacterium]|nr:hypothetical protein [Deltaproteobacteria bacterium]